MKFYIDIDENNNIIAKYCCPQYEGQTLVDIPDENKIYKYIDGEIVEDSQELKQNKISELKNFASSIILTNYPEFKQINAALGLYDDIYKQEMLNFINNIRLKVDEYETIIETLSTNELNSLSFKFDLN